LGAKAGAAEFAQLLRSANFPQANGTRYRQESSFKTLRAKQRVFFPKSARYPKLASRSGRDGLGWALRELGRLERTLFTLQWISDPALRGRVHAGLNKGEARNALARAVFFNKLGELRDRSLESQKKRASGLNLLVAAIILWNTRQLQEALERLATQGQETAPRDLEHLSPLRWEHIGLTGDYFWNLYP
jgi:TnpA family transposase